MTDQLVDTYDGLDHPSAVFVTKIAVVIRDDLPVWEKLNMTAFLASGVAASAPDAVGADYADADGTLDLLDSISPAPLPRENGRARLPVPTP